MIINRSVFFPPVKPNVASASVGTEGVAPFFFSLRAELKRAVVTALLGFKNPAVWSSGRVSGPLLDGLHRFESNSRELSGLEASEKKRLH